jgi:hypothetical protein
MKPDNKFPGRPGGYFFILGMAMFAIGLATGSRALWIVGLCVLAVGLAGRGRG